MKRSIGSGALALAAGMALAGAAAAAAQTSWTSIGPYGGAVTALAVPPDLLVVAYAGTQGGGVFRTTDGAASWQPVDDGLPDVYVSALAVDRAHQATVYAAGPTFLAKSTDSGDHWQVLSPPDPSISALALDPEAPETVYVAAVSGIAKSTDGGATWSAPVSGSALATPIAALTVDPRRPGFVYAATSSGVARSTDGGATWAAAPTLTARTRAVLVSSQRSATVYAGVAAADGPTAAGFYVSRNGGRLWTAASRGLGSSGVTALSGSPSRLYAGTDGGGVFVSTDEGAHWAKTGNASEVFSVNALVVNARRTGTIYAGTGSLLREDQGLRKSITSGLSWPIQNQGLAACAISTLAADPATSGHLVTGTIGVLGAFARDAGSPGWTPIDAGLPFLAVSALAFDPHDASGATIYGTVHGLGAQRRGGALVETTDGGGAWTVLPITAPFPSIPLLDLGGLTVAPDRADTVYVGGRSAVLTIADRGARTTVGVVGESDVLGVQVAPSSPNVLYAAAVPSIQGGGFLYKSVDHGVTWQNLNPPELAFQGPRIAIDPQDAATIFFAGDATLHRSTDGGATWTVIGPGGKATALAEGPGVLYAAFVPTGEPGAIWSSHDAGTRWTRWSDLPPLPISRLVVDPQEPTTLYAGTTGGVYVLGP